MKEKKDKTFTSKLIKLVLPIAVSLFMLNLVSASDALMLGVIGQNELSAVSLAGQVQFVLSLFLAGITIGTGILAAQYWGKGDAKSVEKVFAIALRFTVPVAALFSILTAAIPEQIMRLFTSEEVLVSLSAKYLRTASASYLFCGISQVYLCIMKNCSKAFQSTLITAVCVLADAAMNAVLIFGLFGFSKMGVYGAAVSTVIARFAEFLWAAVALQKSCKVKFRFGFVIHADKELHRDFWKYTAPVLGNELVWGVGITMYTVIMGHLGTDAVAANSVTNIVKNLAVCFCSGLASGGGIMVGNELGAGELQWARTYASKLCRAAIISGILTGILMLCVMPGVIKLSSLSEKADEYMRQMIIICSVYMVGKSVNMMTIAGIFCAGGDSKFGFLCDAVTLWCITVPLGFISAFVLKLPVIAVYMIINADEMLKLPAVYKHYKKYKWVKNITSDK